MRRVPSKEVMRQKGRIPNGVKTAQKSRLTTINVFLLGITALIGGLAWIFGSMFYSSFVDVVSKSVLMGLIFGALCGTLGLIVFIYSNLKGEFEENILTGDSGVIRTLVTLVVCTGIVFLAAIVFQWIYGLNPGSKSVEPTSYIFVIDDSGSMEENDPQQERYKAISYALKNKSEHFPYMIYGFSSEPYIIRKMSPIADGIPQIEGKSSGGTAIKRTLTQVLEDYKKGIWSGGESPKVVLLTDGYATDLGFFDSINNVLKGYVKERISISTVGLGSVEIDVNLMNQIAKTTGGVFIDVKDAAGLSEAMSQAAIEYTTRDLLSTRYHVAYDIVYGFLRVLFLMILGSAIGFTVMIAYGMPETVSLTMLTTVMKSLMGALVVEFGTGMLRISDKITWLILWLLIAITIALKVEFFQGKRQRILR